MRAIGMAVLVGWLVLAVSAQAWACGLRPVFVPPADDRSTNQ